jgi:hypothetical protein
VKAGTRSLLKVLTVLLAGSALAAYVAIRAARNGTELASILIAFGGWTGFIAVLQILAARSGSNRLHRERQHLCQFCGYDLRATPQRCPECGKAAAKAAG